MKRLFPFVFIAFVFSVVACQPKNETKELVKDERQIMLDDITNYEKELHKDLELDPVKAEEMLVLYLNFCNTYKQDSLTPEYLFRAAEIAMNSGKPLDACAYFYRIDKQFKDFDKMSAVIYLQAYVYQNMLGDLENAELYYKRFLNEYPEHSRVKEVQMILDMLYLDDAEMIRKFEENNSTD